METDDVLCDTRFHVRPVTWADFSHVLALAKTFVAQLDYEDPFDANHADRVLEASAKQGLAFVLEDGERVVGVAMALLSKLPWADSLIAHEVMFYIAPEARGGGWGHRLLEALENACRERGVSYLAMVSMAKLPERVVNSVYQAAGFEKTEIVWRKVL